LPKDELAGQDVRPSRGPDSISIRTPNPVQGKGLKHQNRSAGTPPSIILRFIRRRWIPLFAENHPSLLVKSVLEGLSVGRISSKTPTFPRPRFPWFRQRGCGGSRAPAPLTKPQYLPSPISASTSPSGNGPAAT
jgi:hypothetical protein